MVPGAGLEPATFGCLRHLRGFAPHLFRELPYESDALPTKPPRRESPTVGPSLKQSDEPDSGDEFLVRS